MTSRKSALLSTCSVQRDVSNDYVKQAMMKYREPKRSRGVIRRTFPDGGQKVSWGRDYPLRGSGDMFPGICTLLSVLAPIPTLVSKTTELDVFKDNNRQFQLYFVSTKQNSQA